MIYRQASAGDKKQENGKKPAEMRAFLCLKRAVPAIGNGLKSYSKPPIWSGRFHKNTPIIRKYYAFDIFLLSNSNAALP